MSGQTKKTSFKDWRKGLMTEFRKITWPDRDTLTRETVTVTVTAIVLGVIIATLDMILQYGINFLI